MCIVVKRSVLTQFMLCFHVLRGIHAGVRASDFSPLISFLICLVSQMDVRGGARSAPFRVISVRLVVKNIQNTATLGGFRM